MEIFTIILIIVSGLFIGVISVTVGSSSLITIPLLMSFGLNPYLALGTSKFAVLSSFVTGGFKYRTQGMLKNTKLAILLSLAAICGSFIGVIFVLNMEENILKYIIIILLIVVLVTVIFKKEKGIETRKIILSNKKYFYSFIIFFILGIYGGFFGVGFGTFAIFFLIYLLGLSFIESAALMTIINFFAIVIAVIIFGLNNAIDYLIGIPLLVSIAVGGWIGAHFAVLKGNIWIKKLFILITAILIIKLILGL